MLKGHLMLFSRGGAQVDCLTVMIDGDSISADGEYDTISASNQARCSRL